METEKIKSTILTLMGVWEKRATAAANNGDFDYSLGIREIIYELQNELKLWQSNEQGK